MSAAAGVQRAASASLDDMESQPPPPPRAPVMDMQHVASRASGHLRWRVEPSDRIGSWEAQWGFPVMGSWEDLPTTTAEVEGGTDGEMLFMAIRGIRSESSALTSQAVFQATVTGCEVGQWLVFRVRGVNEAGAGEWSGVSPAIAVQSDSSVSLARPGIGGYFPAWLVGDATSTRVAQKRELMAQTDAAAAEVDALRTQIAAMEAQNPAPS
eukprot:COSAG03_NODE_3491_length_1984_cov_1.900796_1_plen_211_part_00